MTQPSSDAVRSTVKVLFILVTLRWTTTPAAMTVNAYSFRARGNLEKYVN